MKINKRFTALDVLFIVRELKNEILGLRLSNIYSISAKEFIFKFHKPSSTTDTSSSKLFLLIESGIRIHLTEYNRDKDNMPNNFAFKLRKHIRAKRLESIRQYGLDRVIDLTFGTGINKYHVIIELYSRGNIILCDHEYIILNVLRTYTINNNDNTMQVIVGKKYQHEILSSNNNDINKFLIEYKQDDLIDSLDMILLQSQQQLALELPGKDDLKKKKKKKKNITIKQALLQLVPNGTDPILIEYVLYLCNIVNNKYTLAEFMNNITNTLSMNLTNAMNEIRHLMLYLLNIGISKYNNNEEEFHQKYIIGGFIILKDNSDNDNLDPNQVLEA